jgi:hypothetical protein
MHITSNMRHPGRIGIFVQCIGKFLVNLKRHHQELLKTLDPELIGKYLDRKQGNAFSMVNPSESSRTLEQPAEDLFHLVERFRSDPGVNAMTSYHLLFRVLDEQCLVAAAGSGQLRVTVRKTRKSHPHPCRIRPILMPGMMPTRARAIRCS